MQNLSIACLKACHSSTQSLPRVPSALQNAQQATWWTMTMCSRLLHGFHVLRSKLRLDKELYYVTGRPTKMFQVMCFILMTAEFGFGDFAWRCEERINCCLSRYSTTFDRRTSHFVYLQQSSLQTSMQSWLFALRSLDLLFLQNLSHVKMSNSRPNRAPLRITPTPFKPSLLSIPPSPFSPRTPLTPVGSLRRPSSSLSSYESSYPSSPPQATTKKYVAAPPASPLSWQWTCHQCAHSYPLAATRRCLDDGHLFCSGTTTVKAWRKPSGGRRVKRHRACASEFDYSGWKAWTRWRRDIREENKSQNRHHSPEHKASRRKDCWNNCSYPSECRWGKKYGVRTPVESVFPSTDLAEISTTYSSSPSAQEAEADSMPTLNRALENVVSPTLLASSLETIRTTTTTTTSNSTSTSRTRTSKDAEFWTSLIASSERRKKGTSHIASPLSVVMEEICDDAPSSASHCCVATNGTDSKDTNTSTTTSTPSAAPTSTSTSSKVIPIKMQPPLLELESVPPLTSFVIPPSHPISFTRSSPPPTDPPSSRITPIILQALCSRKKNGSAPLRDRRRSLASTASLYLGSGWKARSVRVGQGKRGRQ
ncbi:predicted protein [Plenodomus lingam JN3]|uniref:Predicted protein n=1 Tax=Leptosphaeria maculans (strain JN3 / isolate v23.1.3 / race Av1-4-5-6-7-8) TaxID=985895 RepID=E4ZSE2_LEPMJ|nr:predicted protein [Plenodomus lingam JN3]CBX94322.1 predicted protein [Plenodomus lingam JN3]